VCLNAVGATLSGPVHAHPNGRGVPTGSQKKRLAFPLAKRSLDDERYAVRVLIASASPEFTFGDLSSRHVCANTVAPSPAMWFSRMPALARAAVASAAFRSRNSARYLTTLLGADSETALRWFVLVVALPLDPAVLLLLAVTRTVRERQGARCRAGGPQSSRPARKTYGLGSLAGI
jgi:hypothetical protein